MPANSRVCRIKVRNLNTSEAGTFVLHCLYLKPQRIFHEFYKHFSLTPKSETEFSFAVDGDRTLEVCFGKWWASLGEIDTDINIFFDRVDFIGPSNPVTIIGNDSLHSIAWHALNSATMAHNLPRFRLRLSSIRLCNPSSKCHNVFEKVFVLTFFVVGL